jgi:hypothetical protein
MLVNPTVLLHSSNTPILWSSSLDEAFKTRNRLSIPLIALGRNSSARENKNQLLGLKSAQSV